MADVPDLAGIRLQIRSAGLMGFQAASLLDYTEALQAALQEARGCVMNCDWTAEAAEDTEYSHTLEPHDGDHLLERIDALLSSPGTSQKETIG
jgi:hypothetical protein